MHARSCIGQFYLGKFRDVLLTERQVADIVDILQAGQEPAREPTDRCGKAAADAPAQKRSSQLKESVV